MMLKREQARECRGRLRRGASRVPLRAEDEDGHRSGINRSQSRRVGTVTAVAAWGGTLLLLVAGCAARDPSINDANAGSSVATMTPGAASGPAAANGTGRPGTTNGTSAAQAGSSPRSTDLQSQANPRTGRAGAADRTPTNRSGLSNSTRDEIS
ncbi:MAG: hypothetical protein ACOC0P_06175, partial [Planctomycetota bacterium]